MLNDANILDLNADANRRTNWLLLKDQIRAMSAPLPVLGPISVKEVVAVLSICCSKGGVL
jgi:hypothetical protein